MNTPVVDLAFPHTWTAEILPRRPLILPARQFVYPRQAEEVERGALEMLIHPAAAQPFLATFALGFCRSLCPIGSMELPRSQPALRRRRRLCISGQYHPP